VRAHLVEQANPARDAGSETAREFSAARAQRLVRAEAMRGTLVRRCRLTLSNPC